MGRGGGGGADISAWQRNYAEARSSVYSLAFPRRWPRSSSVALGVQAALLPSKTHGQRYRIVLELLLTKPASQLSSHLGPVIVDVLGCTAAWCGNLRLQTYRQALCPANVCSEWNVFWLCSVLSTKILPPAIVPFSCTAMDMYCLSSAPGVLCDLLNGHPHNLIKALRSAQIKRRISTLELVLCLRSSRICCPPQQCLLKHISFSQKLHYGVRRGMREEGSLLVKLAGFLRSFVFENVFAYVMVP